jgi:hypothetical protein
MAVKGLIAHLMSGNVLSLIYVYTNIFVKYLDDMKLRKIYVIWGGPGRGVPSHRLRKFWNMRLKMVLFPWLSSAVYDTFWMVLQVSVCRVFQIEFPWLQPWSPGLNPPLGRDLLVKVASVKNRFLQFCSYTVAFIIT